jgi:hypothetical protein
MDHAPRRPSIAEVEAAEAATREEAHHRGNLVSVARLGELVAALWVSTRGLPRRIRVAMCLTLGVQLVSVWAAGERSGGDDL